jgi:hypothetical protein
MAAITIRVERTGKSARIDVIDDDRATVIESLTLPIAPGTGSGAERERGSSTGGDDAALDAAVVVQLDQVADARLSNIGVVRVAAVMDVMELPQRRWCTQEPDAVARGGRTSGHAPARGRAPRGVPRTLDRPRPPY